MRKILFSTFLITIGLGMFACKEKASLYTVGKSNISESVYASGIIESENQYQLYPTISGTLKSIEIEEGENVHKGQLLFRISNESASIAYESAKITEEFSNFERNENKLKEANASLKIARLKLKNDSLNLSRKRVLFQKNVITGIDFENTELTYQSSLSTVNSLKLQLEDLQKQLKYTDRISKKNLEQSIKTKKDFEIRSDVDGEVFNILKKTGELVNPQFPIAVLGKRKNSVLKLQIDEFDIIKVKPNQKVFVTLDSYKGQVFEAKVLKISPIMNDRSKTFTVDAQFTKAPALIYPNLSLEANILIQTKKNVITIPRDYVYQDTYILFADGKKKKINIGLKDYKHVEVLSGLSTKDKIILPQ
jgi:HlyD family secretion protein